MYMKNDFYTHVGIMGNNILYRGYDKHGHRIAQKIPFSPTLYTQTTKSNALKALDGTLVEPISFETISQARNFLNRYADVDNVSVYGTTDFVSQFIAEAFPDEVEFDMNMINTAYIDIEVYSGEGFPQPEEAIHEVTAICLYLTNERVYRVWGCGEFNHTGDNDDRVIYQKFNSEADLLMDFLRFWSTDSNNPDIITGWHVRFFDIPYLVNRITRLFGEDQAKRLSPWRKINIRNVSVKGKHLDVYELIGIQQLDYFDLFQKFGYSYGQQESYKLDHIAHIVLGERKLSYDEYKQLHDLYVRDYEKYIRYNIQDTRLVVRLDEKLDLINLALTMAYKAGVNYSDTFGSTKIWETIIYRFLNQHNIIAPPSPKDQINQSFEGAYVKAVNASRYDWVASFDVNSMYPNIIVQWNMSPETLCDDYYPDYSVEYCLDKNSTHEIGEGKCIAANGTMFKTNKRGAIPELVKTYYDDRKTIRAEMDNCKKRLKSLEGVQDTEEIIKQRHDLESTISKLNNRQMAIKILMNSLYGSLANRYFKYYRLKMAEAVTLTGQMVIRSAANALNEEMNTIMKTKGKTDYVFYSDTDSCYLTLSPLVDKIKPKNPLKFVDDACTEVFENVLKREFDRINETFHCLENRMVMKREIIANTGIWLSKKRYVLNVLNEEGITFSEPKLKIMGVEAVKSSTPEICRDALKTTMKTILRDTSDKVIDEINTFKTRFMDATPEQVSFPRGVTAINKWKTQKAPGYIKGTPIHVKGAIIYNNLLIQNNIDNLYSTVKAGDKIKFCYLKMPNTLRESVISFPDYLPSEFKLEKYIDKEKQFEKTFMAPIRPILDAAGIDFSSTQSLEDFFS